jgi:endonuclease/exonuclease/phosphatase family metal-dependent hydrolase
MNVKILTVLILFYHSLTHAFTEDLHIVSYNVYFDDQTGINRYPEILKLIKKENYNIIALQECTPGFIELLLKDKHLNKYTMSFGNATHGYQNILLTSLPVSKQGDITLTTQMGRSAPYIILANSHTQIINVHLESGLFDDEVRKKQINEILDAGKNNDSLIIAGDFNFGDGADEELLLSQFHDIGEEDKQKTYDTEINLLAQTTKFIFEPSRRLDRIYIKCNTCKSSKLNIIDAEYSDHWAISTKITKH